METRSDLIAGAVAPGNPNVTPEMIDGHLLELDECGFLTIYEDQGRSVLQLTRPLKTPRTKPDSSDFAPPPVQELSGGFLAVGGAGASASERARARVLREDAERSSEWAAWRAGHERAEPPRRPLLLDAPPIGCPDHPNGTFKGCGPCRTARLQHEKYIAQEVYTQRLTDYEQGAGDGDELTDEDYRTSF